MYGDDVYEQLIRSHENFASADFERIGRWKDNVKEGSKARWKSNVASVAYRIWILASHECPKCPQEREVRQFLNRWSNEIYTDEFPGRIVEKHFGLSRASALLHFVSGARYPIFDARVRRAIERLGFSTVKNTLDWYIDSFCPYFDELAVLCETQDDRRLLDKALFSYGDRTYSEMFSKGQIKKGAQ